MTQDKSIVIYDGDCGICNATAEWIEAHDTGERLDCIPFQTAELQAISPGLTPEMASRMAWIVNSKGRRYGGSRAVFEILKRLPGVCGAMGWLGANPIICLLVEPFYRLFAANRHRVSAMLGLTVCKVPEQPKKSSDLSSPAIHTL